MIKTFKMKLHPGMEEEYERRHNELWPEMIDMIHEHGGRNYTIALDPDTLTLFGYIEIDDPDIHAFERIARKYGVDFAVKRAKSDETKYLVFFKARDADALTAAFQEYTDRRVRQAEHPSLMEILNEMKERVARTAPTRKAERERTR